MQIISNIPLNPEEADAYIQHIMNKYPEANISKLEINVDGNYVNLEYEFEPQNFERIRRITGYLVGTLDRFNPGKLAEVKDRVAHSLGDTADLEDIYINTPTYTY